MHATALGGAGLEVEYLLTHRVGVGRAGNELEAPSPAIGDGGLNIQCHVPHMVHAMRRPQRRRVLRLNQLHLNLAEVHKGVASAPSGCAASQVNSIQLVHVPGDGILQVINQIPGVDDVVNLHARVQAYSAWLSWELSQVHEDAVGAGGVEIKDLLAQYIGVRSIGEELEAPGLQVHDGGRDI